MTVPHAVRPEDAQKKTFGQAMASMAAEQVQTVQASEQTTMAAMNGRASLQEVVQSTVKAELAVETAISVRNKIIEGYQELMRMPI